MVAAEGGEGFFAKSDWRRSLKRLLDGRSLGGRHETPEERASAIRDELMLAKRMIEERTGQDVVHLCYPWHVAGPTARRLAREVGYRTAFCGKVPGVPITLPGGDLQAIARIGEDYVELLPGRERGSLGSILKMKWQRRVAAAARHDGHGK
jgi:peptidoglycan/xylan/chitin deacetylase (PgdA/CDA1 family)